MPELAVPDDDVGLFIIIPPRGKNNVELLCFKKI
jgi:hypothetical protein